MPTFIVDCPECKAKVAAEESGRVERCYFDHEIGEPIGERLFVGMCPRCKTLITGRSVQTAFEDFGSDYDQWSEVERVYPKPPRTFASYRIPATVTLSLLEGDKSIQAGANMAACVMFGRALEAVCRDILHDSLNPSKIVMLGKGIEELKNRNVIDQRLFDWSQQLQAFRNIGAHPESVSISREDAEDLQAFVYAIVEYIYDLADRYEEFKARVAKRKPKSSS